MPGSCLGAGRGELGREIMVLPAQEGDDHRILEFVERGRADFRVRRVDLVDEEQDQPPQRERLRRMEPCRDLEFDRLAEADAEQGLELSLDRGGIDVEHDLPIAIAVAGVELRSYGNDAGRIDGKRGSAGRRRPSRPPRKDRSIGAGPAFRESRAALPRHRNNS